jgi:hypothetical protein
MRERLIKEKRKIYRKIKGEKIKVKKKTKNKKIM